MNENQEVTWLDGLLVYRYLKCFINVSGQVNLTKSFLTLPYHGTTCLVGILEGSKPRKLDVGLTQSRLILRHSRECSSGKLWNLAEAGKGFRPFCNYGKFSLERVPLEAMLRFGF